ncbi:MAG: S9 family peptidase [Planctomycetota bacterium]
MLRHLRASLLLLVIVAPLAAQNRMSPELLWKLGRVGGGSVSPGGLEVLYSVRRYELAENRGDSDLWVVPLSGGEARRLTEGPGSEGDAQWVETAAGLRIFCLAKRDGDDATQVWSLDPASGRFSRVTKIPGGVANVKVAPGGRRIAFTRDVKLDPTVNELFTDLPKADARIIDGLMYRHWDSWHDYAYTHLCVADIGDDGTAGAPRDLMEGLKVDCPVPPFGGSEQFNWSPDGEELAFTMKIANDWARSTNSDVYVARADGAGGRRCVTTGMPGYDNDPVYSPDGRYLFFQSMARAGFESDKNRIMRLDRKTGEKVDLTAGLDRTTHGVVVSPDSRTLWFSSETLGTTQIYRMDVATGRSSQVSEGRFDFDLRDVSPDGKTLVLGRMSMIRPTELVRIPSGGGEATALTDVNGAIYADLELPTVEERWVEASDGKKIHAWVIKPPRFDPEKKYPMLTYFQGGPQGQIGQWFSFRWNFHLMAAHGDYVVVAPNRRGLPGFGRAWNDEISKDWGGQAMRDILAVHDSMCTESYVDPKRVGGIGASYGGYTAYWMMGNAKDRFAAMIAHCGVFDLESMYGSTEELFFVDWDLGGPYWKSKELQEAYGRFSPNRFVGNWKTPLLVIHGQRDYRVPVTQGMEAFTAAQIEGVPSRFLYFPDEGHWVLSPQNGVLWHRVFFDWLARYLK